MIAPSDLSEPAHPGYDIAKRARQNGYPGAPENERCRIALIGGPGGGKTTAADLFRREIVESAGIVPVAATLLLSGGFPRCTGEAGILAPQHAIDPEPRKLGEDRDSEIVAPLFDGRNPVVKKLIAEVIATRHAKGRKIGIRDQAPSDSPECARFLVEQDIDRISPGPDAVLKTTLAVVATEHAIAP
jgi:PEP-utilising enzyme, PEP-binding domain